MTEYTTSLKALLYERVSSPLISSFILSWITWNIKVLVIVYKGNDWSEINYHLENYYSLAGSLAFGTLLNNFVVPATLTYAFLYIIPTISKRVYSRHLENLKELKEVKVEIENEKPITRKEANKLYETISTIESNHNARVSDYQVKIENLESELETRNRKIREQEETEKDLRDKIQLSKETAENAAKKLDEKLSNISLSSIEKPTFTIKRLSRNILYALNETGAMTSISLSGWIQSKSDVHFDDTSLSHELSNLLSQGYIMKSKPTASPTNTYSLTPSGEDYIRYGKDEFTEAKLGLKVDVGF